MLATIPDSTSGACQVFGISLDGRDSKKCITAECCKKMNAANIGRLTPKPISPHRATCESGYSHSHTPTPSTVKTNWDRVSAVISTIVTAAAKVVRMPCCASRRALVTSPDSGRKMAISPTPSRTQRARI